jgi:hypothetical protein
MIDLPAVERHSEGVIPVFLQIDKEYLDWEGVIPVFLQIDKEVFGISS